MVMFVCQEPRDIGVVVRIYSTLTGELEGSIDVLWQDGVYTQNAEDLEVISANR